MAIQIDLVSDAQPLIADFKKISKSATEANREIQDIGQTSRESFKKSSDEAEKLEKSHKDVLNQAKKHGDEIDRLSKDYKTLQRASKSATNPKDIKAYNTALKGTGSQLRSLGKEGKEAFENISKGTEKTKGGFSSMIDIAGGFGIAFGAAAIVEGIVSIGQHVSATISKFRGLRGEVQKLTGATGAQLDLIVEKTESLAVVFEKDFNEVLLSANTLSKEFGISLPKALSLIEKGFLAGADVNDDFLDTLKEYPAQFAQAGGSAERFIGVVTTGVKEGIFSDKFIDSIKEANISLREQTSATKDALQGAFGKTFSDKILSGINTGALSTVDALEMIALEAKKTGLTTSQTSTLIADVFRGAGEDVGGRLLPILENLNKELDDNIDLTNEVTIVQKEMLKVNSLLARSQNDLSASFEASGNIFEKVWKSIQAGFNDFLREFNEGVKFARDLFSDGFIAARSNKLSPLLDRILVRPIVEKSIELDNKLRKQQVKVLTEQAEASIKRVRTDKTLTLSEKANITEVIKAKIRAIKQINQLIADETSAQKKKVLDITESEKKLTDAQIKEYEKRAKEFQKLLDRLAKMAQSARLEQLEGLDRINEIERIELNEVAVFRELLESKGKVTAEAEQQFQDIRNAIGVKASKARLALNDKENLDRLNRLNKANADYIKRLKLQERLELSQVDEAFANSLGDSRDFEEFKGQEILKIKIKFAKRQLELLNGVLGTEAEVEREELKDRIEGLREILNESELEESLKDQKDIFAELFGVISAGLDGIGDVGGGLFDLFISDAENAIDANNDFIDSIKERKNQIEENLQLEIDLADAGLSHSISSKKDELAAVNSELDAAIQGGNAAFIASLEERRQAAKDSLDAEIQLAKDGFAHSVEIKREELSDIKKQEEKAFEDRRELEKEVAELQKKAAIFQLGIDLAKAISSAVVHSAANPENAVTFGLAGALQLAASLATIGINFAKANKSINAAQGFKDGVVSLDGPGTSTSDSIPAFLSKNESVVTAKGTKGNEVLLEGLNKQDNSLMKMGIENLLQNTGISLTDGPKLDKGIVSRLESGAVKSETMRNNALIDAVALAVSSSDKIELIAEKILSNMENRKTVYQTDTHTVIESKGNILNIRKNNG